MWSDRQAVELFHLHFLRLLFAGRDKTNYVVKGGCNLRFFFGSLRYSEDLDLDARGIPPHALKERVDSILGSKMMGEVLESSGLELRRVSKPKQTPTTQRWKLELGTEGQELSLRTKIEFSRRDDDGESALESVDPRLLRRYQLMPILAVHYLLPTAIRQKVAALVGRRQVQARDVFDLSLLLARAGDDPPGFDDLRPQLTAAIERVWEVTHSDFKGQVIAFLEPEHAEAHGTLEAWEAMQLQVVTAMERIRRPS